MMTGKMRWVQKIILLSLIILCLIPCYVAQAGAARAVHLRIIIVNNLSEAKDIAFRIRKGEPFTRLMAGKSRRRTGSGDLGIVELAGLEPPLRKAVAKMKEGSTSGIIRLKKKRFAILQIPAHSFYEKGAAAFRAGSYGTAEQNLLKQLKLHPDAIDVREMLGDIYEGRGELGKAEMMYREIIARNRTNWNAHIRLGRIYLKKSEYQNAKEIFAEGLKFVPESPGLKKGLQEAEAGLSNSSGPGEGAGTEAGSGTALLERPAVRTPKSSKSTVEPKSPDWERSLHLRMILVGSRSEADQVLSELKKGSSFAALAKEKSLDEKSREDYGYLGRIKLESLSKDIRASVAGLKRGQISGIVKLGDRYAIMQAADFHYYEAAEAAFIAEDVGTAEKELLRHLEINRDDAKAHLMLGMIYEDRKQFEKAEQVYTEGISYHPKTVLLYLRLGKMYQTQRRFERSKEVYVEGLRNVPSSELLANGIEMVDILLYGEGAKE